MSCGCDVVEYDPSHGRRGSLSLAERAAKVKFDSALLAIALDAVKFAAQTIRRIYYLCTGQKLMEKGVRAERYIQQIIGNARWDGDLPWSDINDGGRELSDWSHSEDADDYLKNIADNFYMDKWANQPTRVVLCFEKDTLSTMLQPLCFKLDLPYVSFHGQLSDTVAYSLAEWIAKQDCERIMCLYLGDWDEAGLSIDSCVFGSEVVDGWSPEPNTLDIVNMNVKKTELERSDNWNYFGKLRIMLMRFFDGGEPGLDGAALYQKVEYRRIGITAKDVNDSKFDDFKLEAHEYKESESGQQVKNNYYAGFAAKTKGDPRTLGIDALSPEDLIQRAETEIRFYIDDNIWEEREREYQEELADVKARAGGLE